MLEAQAQFGRGVGEPCVPCAAAAGVCVRVWISIVWQHVHTGVWLGSSFHPPPLHLSIDTHDTQTDTGAPSNQSRAALGNAAARGFSRTMTAPLDGLRHGRDFPASILTTEPNPLVLHLRAALGPSLVPCPSSVISGVSAGGGGTRPPRRRRRPSVAAARCPARWRCPRCRRWSGRWCAGGRHAAARPAAGRPQVALAAAAGVVGRVGRMGRVAARRG